MEPVALRGFERILSVLIGGISVYLGYRLFMKMPDQQDSEGKIILPGNISVYLSRVGPGVFFALFGTVVIGMSFYYQLKIGEGNTQPGVNDNGPVSPSISYMGGSGAALDENRANVRGDIFLLNNLPSMPDPDSEKARGDVERAVPRIKLALMMSVWGDGQDWGDFGEFKKWVKEGATDPVPKDLEKPAGFYNHGK